MEHLRILGVIVAISTMFIMSFLAIVEKGGFIYYYEPQPLILIVEIVLFVLSIAVLTEYLIKLVGFDLK